MKNIKCFNCKNFLVETKEDDYSEKSIFYNSKKYFYFHCTKCINIGVGLYVSYLEISKFSTIINFLTIPIEDRNIAIYYKNNKIYLNSRELEPDEIMVGELKKLHLEDVNDKFISYWSNIIKIRLQLINLLS